MSESSPKPAVRPRDASTLILYRPRGKQIEVLMGERNGRHSFMPNRYVFPGGGVEPEDWRVRHSAPLRDDVAERLAKICSPSRARALAAAAVRETFEETGLILGEPDPTPGRPVPANWREFFATGFAPKLDVLDYVVRAVTPPFRPKRFNARFFIADAAHAHGNITGSGELLDLRWVSIEDALTLELPRITAIVLEQIAGFIQRRPGSGMPVRVYRHVHGLATVGEE